MKTNELKCTDLRIGNWIKYTYALSNDIEFCKVTGVKNDGCVYFFRFDGCEILLDANEFQPIELTEEVLLKIGFKKIDNGIFRRKIGFYTLIFNGVMLNIFDGVTGVLEIKCDYLHQLQNAYYCLTGQELNIEL